MIVKTFLLLTIHLVNFFNEFKLSFRNFTQRKRLIVFKLILNFFSIILQSQFNYVTYRVSQKYGNSVTNSISSLLWISIVISNFNRHNIIMSARVYFMKTVNGCKDVSVMSSQDEQWRRTSLLCLYTAIFLFY